MPSISPDEVNVSERSRAAPPLWSKHYCQRPSVTFISALFCHRRHCDTGITWSAVSVAPPAAPCLPQERGNLPPNTGSNSSQGSAVPFCFSQTCSRCVCVYVCVCVSLSLSIPGPLHCSRQVTREVSCRQTRDVMLPSPPDPPFQALMPQWESTGLPFVFGQNSGQLC